MNVDNDEEVEGSAGREMISMAHQVSPSVIPGDEAHVSVQCKTRATIS